MIFWVLLTSFIIIDWQNSFIYALLSIKNESRAKFSWTPDVLYSLLHCGPQEGRRTKIFKKFWSRKVSERRASIKILFLIANITPTLAVLQKDISRDCFARNESIKVFFPRLKEIVSKQLSR